MQTTFVPDKDSRLIDLVKELPRELKLLVQQELKLAKAELSENLSRFKTSVVHLLLGGIVAAVGLLIFMIALGFIAAFAFAALGLAERVADFLGFASIGLLFGAVGFIFVKRALSHLSHESLVPQKTIETLRHDQPAVPAYTRSITPSGYSPPNHHRTNPVSKETEKIVLKVNRTQMEMQDTLMEIQRRLRPRYLFGTALPKGIRLHPLRAALISAGTGLAGFLYYKWHRNSV